MNTCDNLEFTSSIFMYIEIYHCWNIFSKHRKNQKLAPGKLNVKTSQGKKKVDSKIQRL